MSPSLAGIPTNQLLSELQKRIECASKKERRTIFIGAFLVVLAIWSPPKRWERSQ
jgi:hypothetical protein